MRGRRPWLVNGRIDGSGRACQRPRTSSGAKCFSCEGALAREIAFLKFLAINVALPEASPSPFGTATLRLAPSALAPARAPLGGQMCSAQRNIPILTFKFPLYYE